MWISQNGPTEYFVFFNHASPQPQLANVDSILPVHAIIQHLALKALY